MKHIDNKRYPLVGDIAATKTPPPSKEQLAAILPKEPKPTKQPLKATTPKPKK